MLRHNRQHGEAFIAPRQDIIKRLWFQSGQTWDEDIISFRNSFIQVVTNWQELDFE